MRMHSSTRFAALAALAGALACASNKARTDDTTQPDQAAAARDTTTLGRDTTAGRDTTQNPPGYRGMERDTTLVPQQQPTSSDTFLQRQGQGTPQDTAGYSGVERVDTTGQVNPSGQPTDTTGAYRTDTTGAGVGRDTSGMSGMDSTGMSHPGDTTGYSPSQQSDTTTSR